MRTLAALVLVAIIAAPVIAGGQREPAPRLVLVPVDRPSVRPVEPRADRVIVDPRLGLLPVPSRPVVAVPVADVRVEHRDAGGSVPSGGGAGTGSMAGTRGVASWYCGNGSPCTRGYPGGLYAAAGPVLRVGDWRGRVVSVAGPMGRSVRVTLIDWCACPGGRVLDLYSDAFRRLAPLSAGLVKVEVTW